MWLQWPHPEVRADTAPTATVETTSPVKERVQKGTIWPSSERRPPLLHTQRRLSSKDGTVPTAVATTFDQVAGIPARPTRTPSVTRLEVVDTTDTAE